MFTNLLIFRAFTNSTNSITCRFYQFYYNTRFGEDIKTTPRWIGISGIKTTLQDTITALDEISKNSNNAFKDSSWTKTEPDEFKKNLTNVYEKFRNSFLTNTNPSASNKKVNAITPTYISNLGNYQKDNTLLNIIYKEFDLKISASITMIDQAKQYSGEINKYSQPIKDSLNKVITGLDPLDNSFNRVDKDVVTPWSDIVNI